MERLGERNILARHSNRHLWLNIHHLLLYPVLPISYAGLRKAFKHVPIKLKTFVNIRKLENVENIGLYLTAYLADLPLDEMLQKSFDLKEIRVEDIREVEIENKDGKKETKAFIKGARMMMYPKGFHIHRESKGIKKPIKTETLYKNALESVSGMVKTYEKSIIVEDDINGFNMLECV